MPFIRMFAAIHLILSIGASGPDATVEKQWKGMDEATIGVVTKNPRVTINTKQGFVFHLDFATHGALCLAHICAELKTEPRGLTLSLNPDGGMLSVDYDKDAKEARVFLRSGKTPVCKLPLPLSFVTTRLLLRQREQIALYAIPQDGSHVTLVWLGTVGYVINFRNAAQYELCRDLKITMGKRDLTFDEFRKGVAMPALDKIGDVTVSGIDPSGKPFLHHYTFDYAETSKRLDEAYAGFLKAAGNESPAHGEPNASSTPTAPAHAE